MTPRRRFVRALGAAPLVPSALLAERVVASAPPAASAALRP